MWSNKTPWPVNRSKEKYSRSSARTPDQLPFNGAELTMMAILCRTTSALDHINVFSWSFKMHTYYNHQLIDTCARFLHKKAEAGYYPRRTVGVTLGQTFQAVRRTIKRSLSGSAIRRKFKILHTCSLRHSSRSRTYISSSVARARTKGHIPFPRPTSRAAKRSLQTPLPIPRIWYQDP